MCAAMVDRNAEYPDYGRPMYDSQPQNDYGRQSYDYNRPTYDSYQQPGDYNRSSYDAPRGQDYPPYQTSSDPPVQKPVYFTTGGPDEGLPIGNYSQARKVLDQERHRDYNRFIKEKEEQASRRRDEMMHQQQVMPPPPTNQTEMYDHNQMSQQLREERRKEYNDYLKLKETLEHESTGRPITPPGGLAIGGYEVYRNQLKRDRVREYRESLLKKEVNGTPRAPPTPPVGLNIPTEAERHKIAELKKRHYRDELLRQQKEQILNRAQHQLEIPVIDRRQANPDPPPPLHPPQDRPPSGRWDPQSYKQGSFGQVKRVTSPPHQANIGHDDYGAFRRQTELEVRRKDYNEFLAKKQQLEDDKRNKLAEQRRQAPAPIVKGDYYDSEQYDRRRQALNDLQHKEYQNYLKNVDPHKTRTQQGYGTSLPMVESELRYNEFRKIQEAQRNKDYNVLLKHEQHRNRVPTPDTLQGLPLSQRQYDNMRKMQEKQRNQEYNQLLAKKGFNQHQPPETNRRPELGMKSEFQDQFQDPAALLTNRSNLPSSEMEQYLSRRDNQARLNFDSHIQIAPQAISSDLLRTRSGKLKSYGIMTEAQDQFRNPVEKREKGVPAGQEPAGRQSQRNYPVGSLIAGDRVDYPSSANEKFNKERRKEYNEYIKHPVVQRSKDIWKEDEPVHTIPQSGEYKGRRQRLNAQLQKEFQHYQSQKTPPKERVKEFGPQGAVLFDPVYTKETKNRIREERSKDFKEYLEKQDTDRFRRQENGRSENRIGFMSQLGRPVEEMREKLAKERHEEYNKYLQDKYVSQSQHRPLERPKWVDPKLMEDNWQKEAAGSRSRPSSDKPVQTPTYEEMLERKRKEEASYRRFDDPEYSRSGADRGYDAQYRRYNDPQ
ncbi:uncharacterized protein LOC111120232 isoform X22 [Crassostrea virginica]